jgi:exodeoxyribonuclease VII small subunit
MADSLNLKDLLADEGEKKVAEVSFEGGLKLLEELVGKVESGSLPLDKAILSYERGVSLITHLRGVLKGAEQKLQTLKPADSRKE